MCRRARPWASRARHEAGRRPRTACGTPLVRGQAATVCLMDWARRVGSQGTPSRSVATRQARRRSARPRKARSWRWPPARSRSRVSIDEDIHANFALQPGNLVINRVNAPSHLGKPVVIAPEVAGAVFESNMVRCTPAKGVSGAYLAIYLTSVDGKQRLTSNVKWPVNQANINQRDVRSTPVPLPSYAEQLRIVSDVEQLHALADHVESDVTRSETRCRRCRDAIFAWAFSGRLDDQGPNDEPADVLLERIQQERERSSSMVKPKRQRREK